MLLYVENLLKKYAYLIKTLDLMYNYKALVRSYLNYCDIINHIPSSQTQFGATLNAQMEKLKEYNTKQQVASPVHGRVHVDQSS